MSDNKRDQVYELLQQTQLEHFHLILKDQLQITRLDHFKYVKSKDLERVGMPKPAQRRLLDAVARVGKWAPARPPPPPPASLQSNIKNELIKINFNKTMLSDAAKKIAFSLSKNGQDVDSLTSSSSSHSSPPGYTQAVSFLINSKDVEFLKNAKTGEDEILGSGQFGVVKKAIWTTFSGQKITVAVKCLHTNLVDNRHHQSTNPLDEILNEASSMCGLEHEHLIKLYGVLFNTNQQDLNTKLMMVTEYAKHGSLHTYLRTRRHSSSTSSSHLPVKQLFSYVYQIACGMEYLERKKLVHRDLAARNILLYSLEHVKICDFGMTRSIKSQDGGDDGDGDEMYTMNDLQKIPCAWYPPESIREHLFSIKSDVWAFGVCIWEIFTECERQPWPGMNAYQILYELEVEKRRLEQPYLCSNSFYKLVLKCWSHLPSDRPTFKQLKNLIKEIKIIEMKAKLRFGQEGKLAIEPDDLITIVDGTPDRYWWKGQNQRTMLVGDFPRALLDPQRPVSKEDISGPLRNSFIHTGHMSSNPQDPQTWGDPAKIDEIFLKNPLTPPDFFGNESEVTVDITEPPSTITTNRTSIKQADQSQTSSNETMLNEMLNDINLIDFSDDFIHANDIHITHPNYLRTKSQDTTTNSVSSFESQQSSSSPLLPRYFNQQYITNEWQVINTSPSTSNVYYNQVNSNQYLEPVRSMPRSTSLVCQLPLTTSQSQTVIGIESSSSSSSSTFFNFSTRNSLSYLENQQSMRRVSTQIDDRHSYVNVLPPASATPPAASRFKALDFESPKQPVNVDDLLNKVIKQVMSDFDSIKSKPLN